METVAKWLVRIYFAVVALTFAVCSWRAYTTGFHQLHSAIGIMWEVGLAVVVMVATALLPLLFVAVAFDRISRQPRRANQLLSGTAAGLPGSSK